MPSDYDLVIRGGSIVDGSGGPVFVGDVAIANGLICDVGRVDGVGRDEIDAHGRLVTPGFVDIHTHYDGQVTWEHRLVPSSDHGVTTVVMGNCGVGFAPCRPSERDILLRIMEGVEDIPEVVMTTGLPWRWETFPEYLDFLAERSFDVDCAAYLPHAALRVYVMGERAHGGVSTADERARMKAMVVEAMRAGAVGVSTSRTYFHRDSSGALAPHVEAGLDELLALAEGLREAGRGVFQVSGGLTSLQLDGDNPASLDELVRREVGLMRRIGEVAGRPVSFSMTDVERQRGMHRVTLEEVAKANAAGVTMTVQTLPRPIGILMGLALSLHPFRFHPSFQPLKDLPLAEQLAKLRETGLRARLLAEAPDPALGDPVRLHLVERYVAAFVLGATPDYEPVANRSLAAEAERRGVPIAEVAYDALLAEDGHAILMIPFNNYVGGDLEHVREMITDPNCLIGLGDGGAHYGFVCDASFPTYMLSHWTRDRAHGRIALPAAVRALSRRNAEAMGLIDRGLVAPGYRADLNVIDYDRVQLHRPEVRFDLPAGGRRVVQRASGYVATIVDGEVTYRDGEPTAALPGRLVRLTSSQQPAVAVVA